MLLKLNVFEKGRGKTPVKTFTAEEYELSTGVCHDVLTLIDLDLFTGVSSLSEEDQFLEILKIVTRGFDVFAELLKDVFEGLTDDDIKQTKIKEVAKVVFQILKHSISELFSSFGGNEKN